VATAASESRSAAAAATPLRNRAARALASPMLPLPRNESRFTKLQVGFFKKSSRFCYISVMVFCLWIRTHPCGIHNLKSIAIRCLKNAREKIV
jgi:hypothetical protein